MKHSAILLAAGSGTRYGGRKQDLLFHGVPLWQHVYNQLAAVLPEERIVVVGRDIEGGVTRTGSVNNGLEAIPIDTARVIIAEAARPLLTAEQVRLLLDDEHPSSSFAMPLVNTVAYWDGRYIDRSELCELLTPQAFDYKMLLEAYRSGRFTDMTDETRIMYEYHGVLPHYIETTRNLYKVTYPGDLEEIELIWQRMNKEQV